jgi:hypothetical protein
MVDPFGHREPVCISNPHAKRRSRSHEIENGLFLKAIGIVGDGCPRFHLPIIVHNPM